MTREEALRLLAGPDPVGYDQLDEMFRAFGFHSRTPRWDTEVYFHPVHPGCKSFTARDDGIHQLTPTQRALVETMLLCVQASDEWERRRGS